MYNLPYYKEKDEAVIFNFINKNPFAFIAGVDENNRPVATQLPVFIERKNDQLFLTGHMMKSTDHHKAFERNAAALCVFTGPHTYVSATWYANPHQASTWNYMSVHAKGKLRFLNDEELMDVLRKTSLHFEGGNTASSTSFDNLSTEYTSRLMKAIVAFEIEVEQIDTVFKLSQNRDKKSYQAVIEKLEASDANAIAIAEEMRQRAPTLFSA